MMQSAGSLTAYLDYVEVLHAVLGAVLHALDLQLHRDLGPIEPKHRHHSTCPAAAGWRMDATHVLRRWSSKQARSLSSRTMNHIFGQQAFICQFTVRGRACVLAGCWRDAVPCLPKSSACAAVLLAGRLQTTATAASVKRLECPTAWPACRWHKRHSAARQPPSAAVPR